MSEEIIRHVIVTRSRKNEFTGNIQSTGRQHLIYIPQKVVQQLKLKKGDLVQVILSKLTVKEEGRS